MEKFEIIKRNIKPFKGSEGEEVQYAWYKTKRLVDGVSLEFGSMDITHEEGESVELNLEKRELSSGKLGWREVVVKA